MSRNGTILVIWHEKHEARFSEHYLLSIMREAWISDGYGVEEVYGAQSFVAADLAFVHVDVSVVPKKYSDFARRYPLQINSELIDIRKNTFSQIQVGLGDLYDGPVIVKTVLNACGATERFLFAEHGPEHRDRQLDLPPMLNMATKADYKIYDSLFEVPQEAFETKGLIIEKFLPERHGSMYVVREWFVAGNYMEDSVVLSDKPIFCEGSFDPRLVTEAPIELHEFRARHKIDFARIEYVIVDGKPIVLDVNKTIGISSAWVPKAAETDRTLAFNLARGISQLISKKG